MHATRPIAIALCAALAVSAGGARAASSQADILWGVNGHPLASYPGVSIETQLDLVRDLGMRSYRVDIADTTQVAGLRAVVLLGEGRAFCAGLDMSNFGAMSSGRKGSSLGIRDIAERSHGIANSAQQIVWQWRDLPVPVIAAVHGVAYGGGFQLALGAALLEYADNDVAEHEPRREYGVADEPKCEQHARDDKQREVDRVEGVIEDDAGVGAAGLQRRVVDQAFRAALFDLGAGQAALEKRLVKLGSRRDAHACWECTGVADRSRVRAEPSPKCSLMSD